MKLRWLVPLTIIGIGAITAITGCWAEPRAGLNPYHGTAAEQQRLEHMAEQRRYVDSKLREIEADKVRRKMERDQHLRDLKYERAQAVGESYPQTGVLSWIERQF